MTTPYTDPGARLDVALLGPAQFNTTGVVGNQLQFTGRVALLGYCLVSGGAAAILDIYDGTNQQGLLVAAENIPASSSRTEWFGPQGIEMTRGIFTTLSGAGAVFILYFQVLPQD